MAALLVQSYLTIAFSLKNTDRKSHQPSQVGFISFSQATDRSETLHLYEAIDQ
jgi:hypothetical protein